MSTTASVKDYTQYYLEMLVTTLEQTAEPTQQGHHLSHSNFHDLKITLARFNRDNALKDELKDTLCYNLLKRIEARFAQLKTHPPQPLHPGMTEAQRYDDAINLNENISQILNSLDFLCSRISTLPRGSSADHQSALFSQQRKNKNKSNTE